MNKITSLQFLYKHPIWNILFDYQDIKNFYVCGGYIRDYILYGNGGKDIDVFINCTIEELNILITYLEKYGRVVYGQYGSPRFYPNAIDGHYVDIVPFYNFIVSPKPILTIDDLLKNFDFTANAIGINIKTGTIKLPHSISYTEDICKIVNKEPGVELWNNDWVNDVYKRTFPQYKICTDWIRDSFTPIIDIDEVSLFDIY